MRPAEGQASLACSRAIGPRRNEHGATATFDYGGLPFRAAGGGGGQRNRLRIHAHCWSFQHASDRRLRSTEAIRGASLLFRGDCGLRAGWGPGLRGGAGAFRRPSQENPAVGQFPLPFGGAGRRSRLPGGYLRTRRPGLACGSFCGDGYVPDGRGIRERGGQPGEKKRIACCGLEQSARNRATVHGKAPQRPPQSVYFLRHGQILSPDRELRIPGRVLRGDARNDGCPLPERGHTPGLGRAGPTGSPRFQGRYCLRCPRGHRRQPDRLLGGLPGGAAVRPEVGKPREAHLGAPGLGGRSLRASRRQGRLRRPLLLDLACVRSAGGGYEPYALGHVRPLQRPWWGGVDHGGRPGRVLLRPGLERGAALVGKVSAAADTPAPDSAWRLPGLPVGDFPQEQIARARSEENLARDAHPSSYPVSLITASTVSGIESALDCAPCAPASTALTATEWSSPAVNTSVGMRSVTPSLISRTRSSPFPSGSVTSISAASRLPSCSRARASDIEPDSTNVTSSCSAASASLNACMKTCLNLALSSTRRIRISIPNPPSRRDICIVGPILTHRRTLRMVTARGAG